MSHTRKGAQAAKAAVISDGRKWYWTPLGSRPRLSGTSQLESNMGAAYASAGTYAVTGPADRIQDWVGKSLTVDAPHPVEESRVADFCAMVEDGNALYWDRRLAIERYGAPVAPP